MDVEVDASSGSSEYEEIYVEAETGTLEAPFRNIADSTASAGFYVVDHHAEPGVQTDGSATYQVEVTQSDTYRIWGRTRAEGSVGSFYVSINDREPIVYSTAAGAPSSEWRWIPVTGGTSAPLDFELATGTHEIIFSSRESQSVVDVFVVTTAPDFDP